MCKRAVPPGDNANGISAWLCVRHVVSCRVSAEITRFNHDQLAAASISPVPGTRTHELSSSTYRVHARARTRTRRRVCLFIGSVYTSARTRLHPCIAVCTARTQYTLTHSTKHTLNPHVANTQIPDKPAAPPQTRSHSAIRARYSNVGAGAGAHVCAYGK